MRNREKRETIQKETGILPKRETLCLTRADILQKILRCKAKEWEGKGRKKQEKEKENTDKMRKEINEKNMKHNICVCYM